MIGMVELAALDGAVWGSLSKEAKYEEKLSSRPSKWQPQSPDTGKMSDEKIRLWNPRKPLEPEVNLYSYFSQSGRNKIGIS